MLLVGKIIVFLLGMGVAVQVLAAFYRILDLRYTIRTEYPRVIRGILFWGGLSAFIAFLLGDNLRNAFLLGLIFYLPFYVTNFFILQFIIRYRYKKGEKTRHKEHREESD